MEKEEKEKKTPKRPQGYDYYPQRPPKRKSHKPTFVGALLVIVAILGILFSVVMVGSGFFLEDVSDWDFSTGDTVTIRGEVVDTDGDPIEGVTISVLDTHISTETDQFGEYRLVGVPSGFQEIEVSMEGYKTIIFKTHISDSGSDTQNYDSGDIEIHKHGRILDFTLAEGTGTAEYGFDQSDLEKILGGLHGFLTVIGIITLVCSVFALIGAIFALKRENYGLVLAGAVVGIFSFGFVIGAVLSIIALLILIIAPEEFKSENREYQ